VAENRHQAILEKEKRLRRRLYRLVPDYRFSNDLYEDRIRERLRGGGVWVDLGCGRNELTGELAPDSPSAFGLDREIHPGLALPPSNPVVRADLAALPLRAASVDLLTANTVVEHLGDPARALEEMRRALRPGGAILLRTPNRRHPLTLLARLLPQTVKEKLIWRLFGVTAQDVFPTLYRANTPQTLRRLARQAGFARVRVTAVEDVHTVYLPLFLFSLGYWLLTRLPFLAGWRNSIVVEAEA